MQWTDTTINTEIMKKIKDGRNMITALRKLKANWLGYMLRRNQTKGHYKRKYTTGTGVEE